MKRVRLVVTELAVESVVCKPVPHKNRGRLNRTYTQNALHRS